MAAVEHPYPCRCALRRWGDDELVRRIVESFLAYRASVADYMVYADNGQMNARAMDYKY